MHSISLRSAALILLIEAAAATTHPCTAELLAHANLTGNCLTSQKDTMDIVGLFRWFDAYLVGTECLETAGSDPAIRIRCAPDCPDALLSDGA